MMTRWMKKAAALLLAAAAGWLILRGGGDGKEGKPARVYLDGNIWNGEETGGENGDLRVYVTLDGGALIDLPFGVEHTLRIVQADGGENTVRLTRDAVYMEEANCEGQDCVEMGEVTRDNMEVRVMGGFIICLPHRVSVEVRGE